jgi:hypothetical protein
VPDKAERLSVGYLVAQAVLGVVLWITWASADVVRSWFELMPARHEVMDAFVFADLLIGVGGSALSAWGIATDRSWTVPVLAFTAGGLVYPTLYLIGWVSFAGTGAVTLAIMVPVSTFTCWITYQTWKRHRAPTR